MRTKTRRVWVHKSKLCFKEGVDTGIKCCGMASRPQTRLTMKPTYWSGVSFRYPNYEGNTPKPTNKNLTMLRILDLRKLRSTHLSLLWKPVLPLSDKGHAFLYLPMYQWLSHTDVLCHFYPASLQRAQKCSRVPWVLAVLWVLTEVTPEQSKCFFMIGKTPKTLSWK
jgi:hypothetical protein